MTAANWEEGEKDLWLEKANLAFDQSTSYFDNNIRTKIDNSIRLFHSKHQGGSKYYKDAYKYRSKFFRPKTRAAVRSKQAAAAAAFFSNPDVVSVDARDPNNPFHRAAADLRRELLNYRLTETIPWFQILIAAYEDALVPGVVSSIQYWAQETRTITEEIPEVDEEDQPVLDEDGNPKIIKKKRKQVIRDEPVIELIPVENLRFLSTADWLDPINSSPVVIQLVPMYVMDIRARMESDDGITGEARWRKLDDDAIASARESMYDSTRQVREGEREEKYETANVKALRDYDLIWVHRVFMRDKENDWVFYTLGTKHRLSEPEPVEDVYRFKNKRPIVMGSAVIEAHKTYPSSEVELSAPVQKEINENVNQRMDNVKLVLNKRWLVRRGAQVNIRGITRNVPGSVTLVNDTEKDVRAEEFHDVTGSAYQEQDRLNVDFDELTGTFSTSTIQTNRAMNETVGGMAMLRGGVNAMVEFVTRTFSETWVEPVLKQIAFLEGALESDEMVLALAAAKAELLKKYRIPRVTAALLEQDVAVKVNVGMGATDPILKIQTFMLGVRIILEVIRSDREGVLDIMAIAEEVFGRMGYKDGARFFAEAMRDDPSKMQAAAVIQRLQDIIRGLQTQLEDKMGDRQAKIFIEQLKEAGANERKKAELETRVVEKLLDLQNPVAGEERVPARRELPAPGPGYV